MNVGELKKSLEGIPDSAEVVVIDYGVVAELRIDDIKYQHSSDTLVVKKVDLFIDSKKTQRSAT